VRAQQRPEKIMRFQEKSMECCHATRYDASEVFFFSVPREKRGGRGGGERGERKQERRRRSCPSVRRKREKEGGGKEVARRQPRILGEGERERA
jgi:hypothetical protein